MQLISLDELKQLQTQQMSESSNKDDMLGLDFSFKDVCQTYDKQKSILKNELKKDFNEQYYYSKLHDWLKNKYLKNKCPPIKLIGVGSSRTAYACLGGKCLKVAINAAGAAQNKQEQKYTQKRHWWTTTYGCFVNTYGSNRDFGLLMSECCAKADNKTLADAFGMTNFDVFRAIVKAICIDEKHDMSSASTRLREMANEYTHRGRDFEALLTYARTANEGASWLQSVQLKNKSNMSPGQNSIVQLIDFWKKHGISELLPGDVINDKNWGFAIRNGQIAPVMIDVGFSRKIANQYYND